MRKNANVVHSLIWSDVTLHSPLPSSFYSFPTVKSGSGSAATPGGGVTSSSTGVPSPPRSGSSPQGPPHFYGYPPAPYGYPPMPNGPYTAAQQSNGKIFWTLSWIKNMTWANMILQLLQYIPTRHPITAIRGILHRRITTCPPAPSHPRRKSAQ